MNFNGDGRQTSFSDAFSLSVAPMPEWIGVWERTDNSRFLTIRLEVLQLFDYDQSVAKVASVLIRLHNITAEKNAAEEKRREPWFSMSHNKIRAWCLGMISVRSVNDAIKTIAAKGVLTVREGDGLYGTSSYLLNVHKLNKMLQDLPEDTTIPDPDKCPERRKGWVAREAKNNLCKIAEVAEAEQFSKFAEVVSKSAEVNLSKFADYTRSSLQDLTQDLSTPIVPIPENPPETPTAEPTTEPSEIICEDLQKTVDTISDWMHNQIHSMGLRPPTAPASRKNSLKLESCRESLGEVRFSQKLAEFIESGGRSYDKFAASLNAPRVSSYEPRHSSPVSRPAFAGRREVSQHPPNQPSAFVGQIPPHAKEWNERVPGSAWKVWDAKLEAALRGCLANQDFVKHWPEVLTKCAAIDAKGNTVSFGWLIEKGGWVNVVNGERDFLLREEKKAAAPASNASRARAACESVIARISSGELKV
jgi:hypothetical protein